MVALTAPARPGTHADPSARAAAAARADGLERRRRLRQETAGTVAALAVLTALVLGLVAVAGTVGASFSGAANGVASFTADIPGPPVAPPANVTATLTCTPGASTLRIGWTGWGWETGFRIDLYKANVNGTRKLIRTYLVADPQAIGFTVDMTRWEAGRYLVIVSGTDGTQTLPADEVGFQKLGSCA
jgi:hypothetical protein